MEVKIIAEVGSNWQNLEDCIESIHQAKIAGADAVKFQLYTHYELFGLVGDIRGELPQQWLPYLKAEADKRGIEFMCTAFSPEGYELINQFVSTHKVASSECCHLRILQKLRELGKPVILSTGAKGVEDIRLSLGMLRNGVVGSLLEATLYGNSFGHRVADPVDVTLMYCSVAYPSNEVNLDTITALRDEFKCDIGYSDHTTDVLCIPRLAVSKGATVIEKHFTIIPDVHTPDQPHSLNPSQFGRMVKSIRGEITPVIGPTSEEKTAILRYNRRLIVTKDIEPGETLVEGTNFGIYRSLKDDTRAAHPFLVDRFIGKRVKVAMKAGDGLWLDDITH